MKLPGNRPDDKSVPYQQKDDIEIQPYTGVWGVNEAVHLLKRSMFGSAVKDVKTFEQTTLQHAVHELLHNTEEISSYPINDYNTDTYTDPEVPAGKTWVNAPYNEGADFLRIYSFKKWQIGQFINQQRSVQLKMMFFWHNHFATHINDLGRAKMCYNHHQLLREHALGNIKSLTRYMLTDCTMLRYLNGESNTKVAPNENYGRELQELFCIGKGWQQGYTENDVKQAARVLTGWKLDYKTNSTYFDRRDHDNGDKTFSSFYNNTVIKGDASANGGNTELSALMDMIFNTEECALFLCRKIYRWFVYYKIDAQTESEVITPLAHILRKHNYEVKPVLTALFTSNHFYDVKVCGSQIKSPFDYCIGFVREFNLAFPPAENYKTTYKLWESLHYFTKLLNQEYGDPPNVSGWPAYYQVPSFYQLWINAATYPKRMEYATALADYGFQRFGFVLKADLIQFAKNTSDPADPDALINDSLAILFRVSISETSKKKLKKDILLNGFTQNIYWQNAWNNYIAAPHDAVKKSVVETRLKNLYHYLVNAPEFQLA